MAAQQTSSTGKSVNLNKRLPIIWHMTRSIIQQVGIAMHLLVEMQDDVEMQIICHHQDLMHVDETIIISVPQARIWDKVSNNWSKPQRLVLKFTQDEASPELYHENGILCLEWKLASKGILSIEFLDVMGLYKPQFVTVNMHYTDDRKVDFNKPPES